MPDWITSQEAAEASGYALTHIHHLPREGKIGAQRKSRDGWIDRDKLMQYVNPMNKLSNKRHDPRGVSDGANENDGRARLPTGPACCWYWKQQTKDLRRQVESIDCCMHDHSIKIGYRKVEWEAK